MKPKREISKKQKKEREVYMRGKRDGERRGHGGVQSSASGNAADVRRRQIDAIGVEERDPATIRGEPPGHGGGGGATAPRSGQGGLALHPAHDRSSQALPFWILRGEAGERALGSYIGIAFRRDHLQVTPVEALH